MAKRKPERGCEYCGARIDSDGYCSRGCDDLPTTVKDYLDGQAQSNDHTRE